MSRKDERISSAHRCPLRFWAKYICIKADRDFGRKSTLDQQKQRDSMFDIYIHHQEETGSIDLHQTDKPDKYTYAPRISNSTKLDPCSWKQSGVILEHWPDTPE